VDRTPDRSTPDWPVGLPAVLAELARREEVVVDLGRHGRLVVRHQDGATRTASGPPATSAVLDERSQAALHLAGTGLPAVGIAEALGTDLADVAARLAAVRVALGVTSTAAALAVTRGADTARPAEASRPAEAARPADDCAQR